MQKFKYAIPVFMIAAAVAAGVFFRKRVGEEPDSGSDAPPVEDDAGKSAKEIAEAAAKRIRKEQAQKAAKARWAKKPEQKPEEPPPNAA